MVKFPKCTFLMWKKCIFYFYEAWQMVSKWSMNAQRAVRFILIVFMIVCMRKYPSWCLLCVSLQFSGSDKWRNGMRNGKCKKTSLSCELLLFPIIVLLLCISVLVHVFVFKTCWAILQLFSCYSLFTRSMTLTHDKEIEKRIQKGKKNLV